MRGFCSVGINNTVDVPVMALSGKWMLIKDEFTRSLIDWMLSLVGVTMLGSEGSQNNLEVHI
jgi:hypothetical protein